MLKSVKQCHFKANKWTKITGLANVIDQNNNFQI